METHYLYTVLMKNVKSDSLVIAKPGSVNNSSRLLLDTNLFDTSDNRKISTLLFAIKFNYLLLSTLLFSILLNFLLLNIAVKH